MRKVKSQAGKVSDSRMVEAAKAMYYDEGTIEVDDNAPVSRGDDDGAYVQAWVWVNFEEARKVTQKKKKAGPVPVAVAA